MDFSSIRYTEVSPLARQLFQVDGVTRVFFGSDFISVTKEENLDWPTLKPEVLSVITEHYTRGQPLFTEHLDQDEMYADTRINPDDSEALQMIKEIIVARIRPFVQDDGGDVTLVEFDEAEGIVWLQMKGSCAGCPSATVTLKSGIEKMMKHYVPEVNQVCEVENESDAENSSPFRE